MKSITELHDELDIIFAEEKAITKKSEKLLYAKKKLELLKELDKNLEHILATSSSPAMSAVTSKNPNLDNNYLATISYCIRTLAYFGLMAVQLIISTLYSISGLREMLFLIPGMTNLIAIPLGLVIIYSKLRMMYEWERKFLCGFLGFPTIDHTDYYAINVNLLKKIKKMNKKLSDINNAVKINSAEYEEYLNITLKLNNYINSLQGLEYHQGLIETIMKYFVLATQFIMSIAGVFFGAKTFALLLESMFAITIIGTPYLWILGGVMLATNLIFFCAMSASAMMNSNSELTNFTSLKEQLSKFKPTTEVKKCENIAAQKKLVTTYYVAQVATADEITSMSESIRLAA